ncbi:MAG: hypothetical protein M3296_03560 [Actinomycetota bacterium]|nr:hypothetical protein [Actinomycetota bacterium]
MRGIGYRLVVLVGVALLAMGTGGCAKKKKKKDPVATALKTPGIRVVTIPKQRSDLTIYVPPCSQAQVQNPKSRRPPSGSNQIVVPRGSLTQSVAVPPCPEQTPQTIANTVILTPGGQGSAQSSESGATASQLVLPANSNVTTLVVPPCTAPPTGKKKKKEEGTQSFAFPATSKRKSVTAPPCTVPEKAKKK